MMLRARCFFVLASFALMAAPAAGQGAKDAKDADKLALEGAWALVKFEEGGKQEADEPTLAYRVLIAGNNWYARFLPDDVSRASRTTFWLDPGKSPREITIQARKPNEGPIRGIYALDGDTLTVCYARPGAPRPTEFRTKSGDKRQLLTFARITAGPDEPTRDSLVAFLKERFALALPPATKVANLATRADPVTRKRPVREVFAEITLAAADYQAFRKGLLAEGKRPEGQRMMWEGKERPAMIGGIPGPDAVPRAAAKWWTRNGADTLVVLSNEWESRHFPSGLREETFIEQTGAVVLFMSEKQNRVMLWAFVNEGDKAQLGAASKVVELRGFLTAGEAPPETHDLRTATKVIVKDPKAPLTGVTLTLGLGKGSVEVDFADDKLKAAAKELNGRQVVVTGEVRKVTVIPRSYQSAISGLEVHGEDGRWDWIPLGGAMPENRYLIRATGLKPVGPKPAPWSGAPVTDVKWVRGGKMSTFQRLPKANEVTALWITRGTNQTKVRLTAATFLGVLSSLKPVKADDPKYKDWGYADWYSVEFETAEGRFRVTLYLGGLGLLSAPDGSVGLVTFEAPK